MKSPSAPIGSCSTSGVESRRSTIMSTQRKKSAPVRSSLLTKQRRGTEYLLACRHTVIGLRLDAGDTVEDRDSAVEDAQRSLDLDGEVDVAGRVDDVDLVWSFHQQVVAADVIVMPRSCSCSIQSIVAAPSWTSPIL